jgi:hypothetical protein
VKAGNSSSSSSEEKVSEEKVSAARPSRDRIGWVFFAASSSSTDRRGRADG